MSYLWCRHLDKIKVLKVLKDDQNWHCTYYLTLSDAFRGTPTYSYSIVVVVCFIVCVVLRKLWHFINISAITKDIYFKLGIIQIMGRHICKTSTITPWTILSQLCPFQLRKFLSKCSFSHIKQLQLSVGTHGRCSCCIVTLPQIFFCSY